jgi:hypothetical protein
MAETKRMTCEQVVWLLARGEGRGFLRESLSWVVQQLMEAEVSEQIGAARGERAPEERLTHRNGYRARPWQTWRASSSWRSRSRAAAATSPASSGRGAEASRRSSRSCRGVRRRHLHAQGRPRGRVARLADLEERGLEDLPGARPVGRRHPQPPARGPLPVPLAGRQYTTPFFPGTRRSARLRARCSFRSKSHSFRSFARAQALK